MAFFDLDETLLAPDHVTVSPRTRNALSKMREAGILLIIATGRSRALLPDCLAKLPFDYHITANGADIADLNTGKHIHTSYLPKEDAFAAWDLIKSRDLLVEWYVFNEVGIDAATKERLDSFSMPRWHKEYFQKGCMPVFESVEHYLSEGAKGLEKINLPRFNPVLRDILWRELDALGRFTLSSSSGSNIEINRKGCTKGQAIRALCRHLKIPVTRTMAFGDGGNDVEMLGTVGMGVAMANGTELAKRMAQAVAGPYDQDGVAVFIEGMLA